jgi:uncharacterized protein YdcH (DUF465 family)
MKMPVSWHKERLANMGISMEHTLRQVEQLQCTLQRLADEHAVLREQIERAEAEGRDGFDQEKFGIKRAKQ